jgi:hypothetical protein
MKPDKEGIFEWFDDHGNKRLVMVINIGDDLGEHWFRVFWWGGYYNVNDEAIGTPEEDMAKAEWPDRWGNFVGEIGSIPTDQLYLQPTVDEYRKMMEGLTGDGSN